MKKPVIYFYHPGTTPVYAVVESVQVFDAVCNLRYIPDAPSIRIVSEDASAAFDAPAACLTADTKELKRWIYRVLRALTGYELSLIHILWLELLLRGWSRNLKNLCWYLPMRKTA